ncbi:TIGR01459 family HAD-type hydrolase [Pelagibacterium xiamenense]|uniref:TIGR01459 family HAD-type hydrolase n=1 Tax=Pelagibacterium xiamenense TaxID=2901140 RepID=UPI001E54AF57|nr:TIGR01459 family HAD-type hydrolase [Pelagibacterium xiamenense]MCD7059209.1 TIGR01459 family HAD-type hydrolase [Pelagibacterium xiamenense]
MTDLTGPLPGLSVLTSQYHAILSDVWGVVHNGVAQHEAAVDALTRFRAQGGRVVLITNAPRPRGPIIAQLDALGVSRDAYDGLISSGDATRTLLEGYKGKTIHRVGPEQDDMLFDGLDIAFGDVAEASAVVVTDLDTDDETPDDYRDRMEAWLARGLPMICANPDKVVEEGDRLVYCGGALADAYEDAGGRVMMAGKPFNPIYEQAKDMLDTAGGRTYAPSRVLAIGDSLRTDAMGAAQFGIDLLFVTGSIHAEELDAFNNPPPQRIANFISPSRVRLAGYMPKLAW